MYRSILSYGGPGTGKTALGVSSFWDFLKKEPVEGQTGRLLLIGRESNPDLDVPDEFIKRFPVDRANPLDFVENLKKYMVTLLAKAKKQPESRPTNIVLDGFSELGLDFLWAHQEDNPGAGKWDKYSDLKRDLTEIFLMWNPDELQANLFSTARVTRFKKQSKTDSGKVIEGDPDWMSDTTYHPALDGFWRDNLGHYFNHIVYHEMTFSAAVEKGGKTVKKSLWLSHWLPTGDYTVKNTAAHKWPLNATLENVSWPTVMAALEKM